MVLREHYCALWHALQKKDYKLALKIQRRTNVLNQILCEKNNISAYKVLLRKEGIIRTAAMRAPMESLTVREEEELLDSLRQHRYREVLV